MVVDDASVAEVICTALKFSRKKNTTTISFTVHVFKTSNNAKKYFSEPI
jgi:hypothetical protein